jgi:hypothetical protein
METSNAKIIVACHKQADYVWNDDVYMPVHVGAVISSWKYMPWDIFPLTSK